MNHYLGVWIESNAIRCFRFADYYIAVEALSLLTNNPQAVFDLDDDCGGTKLSDWCQRREKQWDLDEDACIAAVNKEVKAYLQEKLDAGLPIKVQRVDRPGHVRCEPGQSLIAALGELDAKSSN